ncbi:MAG: putative transporter ATP-binding protein [Actinomycetia bacterium]|nr:putative transporter ATP-binding protein [Actinomycetes bacterium]
MSDATSSTIATGKPSGFPVVPAVEMRGIIKRFGSTVACDRVDLVVQRGEIHGLLGQNGAGKSTLMKVLTGLLTPDAGVISIDGVPRIVKDPHAASKLGIAMVHQHFSVIEALTVWENVVLGEKGRLDEAATIKSVRAISERYGLDVDPTAKIATLTAGQRQRVEIIKCLRRDPSIVILDEPTSVLTLAESEELFSTLRYVVRDENRAVVLISHKLDEILNATDQVCIMRSGLVVAQLETAATDARSLAREMVGREVSLRGEAVALGLIQEAEEIAVEAADAVATPAGDVALRIDDVTVKGPGGVRLLDHLDLEIRQGEILGLAGVEGNGQVTLANVLSSLTDVDSGTVEVAGRAVRAGKAGAMARAGVAVIPEDRHAAGCVLDMSVAENLVLDDLDRVSNGRLVSSSKIRENAIRLIQQFDIMCPSPDTPMRFLSGGNQQRVVLARQISRNPKVLVAAQPTHGLDVGAVEYMTEQLRRVADEGVAVLLISTELEEILALSDRIAVINEGRIMGTLDRQEADLDRIGLMMGGQEL